jgi:hypothetical protein
MAEQGFSLSEFVGLGGRAQARAGGCPRPGASQAITTNAVTSTANASKLPEHATLQLVAVTNPCYVRASTDGTDGAVVDQDFYVPVGVPMFIQLGNDEDSGNTFRFLSAKSVGGGGKLVITIMDVVAL